MTKKPHSPRRVRGHFIITAMLGLISLGVAAAPYRPVDDAQLLLQIPASASQARALQGRTLPAEQAAGLAQIFIQRARASGDPRYLGYAQGVLAPWWNQAEPPDSVLLMRATLRQSHHQFSAALDDLDVLLQHQPEHTQAWLTRATVLRVLGRYEQAQTACQHLHSDNQAFISQLCSSAVRGLNGQLTQAATDLDALAAQLPQQSPGIAAWYFAERCDMAVRQGRGAQPCLQQAQENHPEDIGLRSQYADWLLDQQRPQEVLALIPASSTVENLLLRRALALHQLKDARFDALNKSLDTYFSTSHQRGEDIHLREEARYRLAMGDVQTALELAKANWQVQHEPWDVRVLLAAATAANDKATLRELQKWLASSQLQDVRLQRWLP